MGGAGLLANGELGGPLVGGGRGGVPAASFGARTGRVQVGDDRLVGAVDGRGPVPGVPVRVVGGVEGFGQRPVRFAAFHAGRGLVHRGPDQRMPHRDSAAVDDEQPGPFRGVEGARVDVEDCGGPAHRGDLTGVVGGGDQQQRLHRRRQPAAPVQEDAFHPDGEVQLGGHRRDAGQLLTGQRGGELDERERVPGGLGHQPVRDLVGHGVPGRLGEQRAGRCAGQRRQRHAGDVVGCERAALAVAGGEHDGDPVGAQPPRGDQDRVRGGLVEPLRVVDDAQHGRVLGGLGQHRQGRQRHQERLHRDVVLLAERGPQRAGLRSREPVEGAEHGTQQPVQRGERQRRLGLQALRAQHPHVAAGVRDEVLEQRGLPHPGLPVQQQGSGPAPAGVLDERGEASPLGVPPVQHNGDANAPTPPPGWSRRIPAHSPGRPSRIAATVGVPRRTRAPGRTGPFAAASLETP